tara:strand:+ start:4264 stop:5130 length:867 start_codon:yes stop_codon:yes gene_type:complete
MFINEFLQYITTERRLSDHTIQSYSVDLSQFSNYLSLEFNISHVTEINFQLTRSWIASLLEEGIQPVSINRKISTLRTYFRFLLKKGVVKENPMLKIIPPKSKKRLPVFIEEFQIKELLDKIDFKSGFVGERDKLIIEFFYFTGIRLSELIELRVRSIDFQNGVVKVIGKRNKERLIPLLDNMLERLESFISTYQLKEFLFTTSKFEKLYTKLVYRVVNKYIGEISTLEKRSPHILRHTFATHMLNNGADINAIKELLGHANLSATQIYTHNTIDKLKLVYKQAHPRA